MKSKIIITLTNGKRIQRTRSAIIAICNTEKVGGRKVTQFFDASPDSIPFAECPIGTIKTIKTKGIVYFLPATYAK